MYQLMKIDPERYTSGNIISKRETVSGDCGQLASSDIMSIIG